MGKVGGSRNLGYGKKLSWAAKNALDDRYGHGHFATKAAHLERWNHFLGYLQGSGLKDARNITTEHLLGYGEKLKFDVREGHMKVAYAQNILSSVNVVLEAMRCDKQVSVSPASLVGVRTNVRIDAPASIDRERLNKTVERLHIAKEMRVAVVATLARELGLRFREASLLDAKQALAQATKMGRINVTEGTKGGRGREVDRWVPVTPAAKNVLKEAVNIQGSARNLVPADMSFKQWKDHAYHAWNNEARENSLKGFHDLRAAYACDRYQQLTGKDAPVVTGGRIANKQTDLAARNVISYELGHSRIEIAAAYLGSSR